ncbi:MAG TPA: FAD binding domain-containing protein, partial [Vicinamibacterales bacterium]|nr:FAD binding domain-containing protein [Vicinamibacterales bacterium]
MIPAAFDYQRATSVEDALAKLAASNGTAKFIAGGHSLVPAMKMRLAQPAVLIDIARVPAL